MTYIPSTPIKYVKAATTGSAVGFGTHLWDYLSNQDGEFCRKSTANYTNTKLKGLYFSNWFFSTGGSTLDYKFNCVHNTIGENVNQSTYTGATSYKNAFLGAMEEWGGGVSPYWHSTIFNVGAPIYGVNASGAANSVGTALSTSRHLSSHIFMLPIAENR